ncbi:putative inorganic phosphate cotransporter [Halotydeus destructor]|nr:putative inorganic phosphate cotransporter [Halotydeus destructor]
MLGVVQGGVFPACFAMLCNWLPVKERNVAFGFIDFGINLGAILSGPITGALCDHMGWPYAFYLPGTMAVGVLVIFLLLTTSSPNDHPRVKSAELELIKNDHIQDGGAEEDSKPPLPWMKMLTSKVVIATIVARFAMGWTFLLIQTELPAYLSDILHMQPTKNGAVNSLMYISANITLASFGYLTESMIGRNWIGRTRARKLVIVASRLGMMVSFLCIPSAGCSQVTVVALLMTAMLFYGMGSGGDIPLPSELTKNYPATLFALINTIGSSAGFIAPYVVGVVLDSKSHDIQLAWNLVFFTSAAICGVSGAAFAIFGSAERQSWDIVKAT